MDNQIIEIYLFVDPLGKRCNRARKTISGFREKHAGNIRLRVIPIVNSKKVLGFTRKQSRSKMNSFVEKNNQHSTNTYRACLAFHASTMQGKKAGCRFLNALQSEVIDHNEKFSEQLVFDIVDEMDGLDVEMFMEDYKSDLAKNIYRRTLQLASEMKITKTPSCVIFKNGTESEAIRLDKEIENELLHVICGLDEAADQENKQKGFPNILNLTPQ